MNADAETDRLRQILGHVAIEPRHARADLDRGLDGLTARRLGIDVEPEERQQPVADELVGLPTGSNHRLRHGCEEPVDHEHRIERQPALRESGRAAHVSFCPFFVISVETMSFDRGVR